MPEMVGPVIGLMSLFLFFVAVLISGEGQGDGCPHCEHCRTLRGERLDDRRALEALGEIPVRSAGRA